MFEKEIVIDAKGHIAGRLAAKIAKELLSGQRVVVVRVERVILSGSLFRRRIHYMDWVNKISNTNPRKGGPYHFKAPSRLFWRMIRGMLPHKTARGKAALERLKVFEGMPYPYSIKKKTYAPVAIKAVRLLSNRKFCQLGELSKSVGWNKSELVTKLESKRETFAHQYHERKAKLEKSVDVEVKKNNEIAKLRAELKTYGY